MLSNKSELFVEISEEQQEVAAGGQIDYGNFNGALYDLNGFTNASTVIAGPSGAGAVSVTTGLDVFTGALSVQGLRIT